MSLEVSEDFRLPVKLSLLNFRSGNGQRKVDTGVSTIFFTMSNLDLVIRSQYDRAFSMRIEKTHIALKDVITQRVEIPLTAHGGIKISFWNEESPRSPLKNLVHIESLVFIADHWRKHVVRGVFGHFLPMKHL